jgi:hypothetical protein
MVIFSHRREDLEVESRTRRTRSQPFNMQVSKSTGPSSLGEADFNCKYSKHVSLNYLALFILKKIFQGPLFRCR